MSGPLDSRRRTPVLSGWAYNPSIVTLQPMERRAEVRRALGVPPLKRAPQGWFSSSRRGSAWTWRSAPQLLAVWLCAMLAQSATPVPRIEVLEGDGAINNIRLHRAKEPVVRVVDQEGQPIPDVAVTFLLPTKGASGTFAEGQASLTVMTDDKGMAVGRGLRPNGSAGQFQIRVATSFQGQAATANISQTNAEPAQGGGSSKAILIVALVGGAAAAGAAVALSKGKSSASTPPNNPGVVINPGNPSFGPPR